MFCWDEISYVTIPMQIRISTPLGMLDLFVLILVCKQFGGWRKWKWATKKNTYIIFSIEPWFFNSDPEIYEIYEIISPT